MITLLMILEVIIAILLVIVILLQSGKGSELGISIGAGASQTLFGGSGAGNFLTKTTAVLATIFFINAFTIGILFSKKKTGSIFSSGGVPVTASATPQSANNGTVEQNKNAENGSSAVTKETKKEFPKEVSGSSSEKK